MNFDEKLDELFIDLPEPPTESGNSTWAVQTGKQLFVGSALPFSEGRIQYPGRVGIEVKLDTARLAARTAAIMLLSFARKELGGSLDRIKRLIRLDGFVACGADFRDHVKVVDGASELFISVFGPQGRHVRNAVGAMSLPQNACIALSAIFEVK